MMNDESRFIGRESFRFRVRLGLRASADGRGRQHLLAENEDCVGAQAVGLLQNQSGMAETVKPGITVAVRRAIYTNTIRTRAQKTLFWLKNRVCLSCSTISRPTAGVRSAAWPAAGGRHPCCGGWASPSKLSAATLSSGRMLLLSGGVAILQVAGASEGGAARAALDRLHAAGRASSRCGGATWRVVRGMEWTALLWLAMRAERTSAAG